MITVPSHTKKDNPKAVLKPRPRRQRRDRVPTSSFPATVDTRNPALVLAGTATSVLFGLQRRTSGGILAPALTHLTWSLLMLRYLPPLFQTPRPAKITRD